MRPTKVKHRGKKLHFKKDRKRKEKKRKENNKKTIKVNIKS